VSRSSVVTGLVGLFEPVGSAAAQSLGRFGRPGFSPGGNEPDVENPWVLPSGKLSHDYGKSQFLLGKSTINGQITYLWKDPPCY